MAKRKTKAIGETVASVGQSATKNVTAVGRSMQYQTLSPKSAYEASIHARKAVDGKATQMAKAKLRFFSRTTGDEIVDGEVVQLYRHPSSFVTTHNLIRDQMTWLNIAGEFVQWAIPSTAGGRPKQLLTLDPTELMEYPYQAKSYETLEKWIYTSTFEIVLDGRAVEGRVEIPMEQIALGKLFNPNSRIRGLSPMQTGTMEISTNYFANRFNSNYFQNGTAGDVIIRFPEGTRPDVAESWVEEWQLRHSIYGGNGFKIQALIGTDMQIEDLATTPKDGQFLQLSQWNAEQIGGLFGVPPSVMGFLSKTRFDTIDVELEAFAENTLMPEMFLWSEVQQTQVLDRFFRNSSAGTKKLSRKEMRLGHYMKAQYEQAMDTRTESDVIILLDPDTLPIMAKLMVKKFELIDKIRSAADLSANEAAEYVGVELPYRSERDEIWVPSSRQKITGVEEAEPQVPAETPSEEADDTEEEKSIEPEMKSAMRKYRSLVLKAAADGCMFEKKAALGLFQGYPKMIVEVHKDFLSLRPILKSDKGSDQRVAEAREYVKRLSSKAAMRQFQEK